MYIRKNLKKDVKLDFNDVLIEPKRSTLSSRSAVDLTREFTFRNSGYTWKGIPIIAANMDSTGTLSMAKVLAKHGMLTCLSRYEGPNLSRSLGRYTAKSYGICTIDTIKAEFGIGNDHFLCLDVANGYTETFLSFVANVRDQFPSTPIIAGNVATPEIAETLVLAGADIVKVGLGSGGLCLTRRVTGVGYPQLSAVIECAAAVHAVHGHIISDGGCINIGDVAKAFGAGADFVMLGSMLSGYDECGGDRTFDENGNEVIVAYGMSSDTAMSLHGGKATYRASEGRTVSIRQKGPVTPFLNELMGGLRSTCAYIGAPGIRDIAKRTTFIKVNRQLNTSMGD